MELGAFSVSLNVQNIQVSKEFYEKLGFSVFAGSIEQKYLILKNDKTLIGLFEKMFDKNILTFNPGWDENANTLESFEDIRTIQEHLMNQGIPVSKPIDKNTSGPANIILIDPDGNPILIDQHV